jgi:hypothetical protein
MLSFLVVSDGGVSSGSGGTNVSLGRPLLVIGPVMHHKIPVGHVEQTDCYQGVPQRNLITRPIRHIGQLLRVICTNDALCGRRGAIAPHVHHCHFARAPKSAVQLPPLGVRKP